VESLPIRTMASFYSKSDLRLPGWFWRPSLALLSGLIAGPALPRAGIWPLVFVSVFLMVWSIRRVGFWSGFGIGFVGGAAFYASQSVWMSAYLGPEPWLALAVLEGLICGFATGAMALIWQNHERSATRLGIWDKPLLIVGLALAWVSREWLCGHLPYGGYQWSRLGQPMVGTVLERWAYWGGISAVSLSVATISITFVVAIDAGKPFLKSPRAVKPRVLSVSTVLLLIPALIAILVPLITFVPNGESNKTVKIAAVQGNANAGLFANPIPGSILAKHVRESRVLARDPKAIGLDFVVWPENSSDQNPLINAFAALQVYQVSNQLLKAPLFLGTVTWQGDNAFNSVLLFDPGKSKIAQYNKRRPVPFAEYVPDRPFWFAIAPDLIGLINHGFSSGNRPGIFQVAGTRVGSLICFEIGIDDLSHDLVTGGAQMILSQANNSDFGHTDETFQQEALARLQAISTGRAVVHVSTVGVTELILPNGRVTQQIPAFKPGFVLGRLPLTSELTPAMRFYGWVDALALSITGLLLAFAIWLRGIAAVKRFRFGRA
jgi:apolipoprotein N-acyltransferase